VAIDLLDFIESRTEGQPDPKGYSLLFKTGPEQFYQQAFTVPEFQSFLTNPEGWYSGGNWLDMKYNSGWRNAAGKEANSYVDPLTGQTVPLGLSLPYFGSLEDPNAAALYQQFVDPWTGNAKQMLDSSGDVYTYYKDPLSLDVYKDLAAGAIDWRQSGKPMSYSVSHYDGGGWFDRFMNSLADSLYSAVSGATNWLSGLASNVVPNVIKSAPAIVGTLIGVPAGIGTGIGIGAGMSGLQSAAVQDTKTGSVNLGDVLLDAGKAAASIYGAGKLGSFLKGTEGGGYTDIFSGGGPDAFSGVLPARANMGGSSSVLENLAEQGTGSSFLGAEAGLNPFTVNEALAPASGGIGETTVAGSLFSGAGAEGGGIMMGNMQGFNSLFGNGGMTTGAAPWLTAGGGTGSGDMLSALLSGNNKYLLGAGVLSNVLKGISRQGTEDENRKRIAELLSQGIAKAEAARSEGMWDDAKRDSAMKGIMGQLSEMVAGGMRRSGDISAELGRGGGFYGNRVAKAQQQAREAAARWLASTYEPKYIPGVDPSAYAMLGEAQGQSLPWYNETLSGIGSTLGNLSSMSAMMPMLKWLYGNL